MMVATMPTIVNDQWGPMFSYILTEAGLKAPETTYREKVMNPRAEAAYLRYTKIVYIYVVVNMQTRA